ncbi:probable carboxylesterase 2 [Ricinus communis]|uniref:Gibberellin receptor GID1, putative n=1 Tax=Ricinus communis TaxID=3988 RepID=B9R7F8_RICCO|nr:probable carboxylesterase 2 [Ricinus communis]EEF52438.1 Gibberellin receptor GID1, putative [Ricinus communis]|eukprot:XP_002510251.1 probable carboxylesterase 2 [Ricinus communis]
MSPSKEVSKDVFPYLRVYADGTIQRYAGTEVAPAGFDSQTRVLSKDIFITISQQATLSARLYRPDSVKISQKLPVLIYFHGGAFCIASAAEPKYHHCMNQLVSQANVIVVSVDYRLAPENPLPAAYGDSGTALQWVGSGGRGEPWLEDYADFGRLFLAGDSAGANIVHHLGLRVNPNMKIKGIVMIHPYFWGKDPIGKEVNDSLRKSMVDTWWMFVCPSDKGCDDPLINPFADGAPSVKGLGCESVLVFTAEKDILCERGQFYYENLVKSGWKGKAEIVETKGEDHVFHIFNPDCDNARVLIKRWASYINQA